ncbi:hypothetical protein LGL08_20055 [Clostridium estertheticum]|uniref:hypothetical protein n=1 Tax=Clostridium estertheticum TaxID=238834 RepID=UPI001CF3BB0C|nr:hypothetical protein [Clostridium estertheticum]MCB2308999.1 hypothetical protein [Clostridium estertheticum]MCB2346867.1 hypothetical protein [Clostridium estertheticum]MCB2351821.1 hypothetical protein [Clostridium estertheticum]WAG48425.1 hypothetical protein LL127_22860 [Clostridium estertheticum]
MNKSQREKAKQMKQRTINVGGMGNKEDSIYKTTVEEIESKKNLKVFMDGIPQYLNMCTAIAKGEMIYYKELLKQGFTEEQSLKIIMEHGSYPGRSDRQLKENE